MSNLRTQFNNWKHAIREWLPGYDPVADVYLPQLRDGNMLERIVAAEALNRAQQSPKVYQALCAALADPEPFVRWQAAQTLKMNWEDRRWGYLLPLLQYDNPELVEAALWALPQPLPEQAGATVLAAAKHQSASVRASALMALALTDLPGVPELLANGLTAPEAIVRIAAVQALAQRGGTAARLLLEPLTQKWEPPFSDLAKQVLSRWEDNQAAGSAPIADS